MAENGDAENARGPAADTEKQVASGPTEWTASDTRGPLNAASSEGEHAGPAPEPEAVASPVISDEAAAAEPQSAPAQATAGQTPERRRVPVLPIIGALIVGSIIGAGSAAAVYQYEGQGQTNAGDQVAALSSRVDAVEKRPDPQSQIDAVKASVDKLNAAPQAAAFDPAPLQQKIASLQSAVDDLKKQGGDNGLGQKVAALDGAVAELKSQVGDVKSLGDKVSGVSATVDGLKQDVDGLKKQDATTDASVAALQSGQKTLEGKITNAPALAVVADSLVEVISHGQPYAGQVDALASIGADPAKVAVLRENADKGVPSAQALAAKFAPLADPIMASASRAPANAGLMDRLKSGMMGMVQIRRADATAGDDVGSRVSRIEDDLAHDDVAGAYAAWDGLPPDAKAKSEAWGALAKTAVEAMSAARALQQQAIASLGSKKS